MYFVLNLFLAKRVIDLWREQVFALSESFFTRIWHAGPCSLTGAEFKGVQTVVLGGSVSGKIHLGLDVSSCKGYSTDFANDRTALVRSLG